MKAHGIWHISRFLPEMERQIIELVNEYIVKVDIKHSILAKNKRKKLVYTQNKTWLPDEECSLSQKKKITTTRLWIIFKLHS
jgi:hypothetical protein